jgi:hypothetical protein
VEFNKPHPLMHSADPATTITVRPTRMPARRPTRTTCSRRMSAIAQGFVELRPVPHPDEQFLRRDVRILRQAYGMSSRK